MGKSRGGQALRGDLSSTRVTDCPAGAPTFFVMTCTSAVCPTSKYRLVGIRLTVMSGCTAPAPTCTLTRLAHSRLGNFGSSVLFAFISGFLPAGLLLIVSVDCGPSWRGVISGFMLSPCDVEVEMLHCRIGQNVSVPVSSLQVPLTGADS